MNKSLMKEKIRTISLIHPLTKIPLHWLPIKQRLYSITKWWVKKLPHVLWDKMCQISLVSQQNMQNLWKIFAFFPPIFFFTWPGVNYSLSTNLQQLAWQCMYMYVSGQNIVSIFWWQTVHCHDIWWSSHIRNIFNIFFHEKLIMTVSHPHQW